MASENTVLRILLVIVAVVVLVPVLMMAFMMPMMGMWGWGHMDGGTWGGSNATWMWLLMWLVGLAVVAGVGYLLYRVVRGSVRGADPAVEELRAAYARGDLSDEEYERRRERLQRGE